MGCRVRPFEAYNVMVADSVLVLDCCVTKGNLVMGAVALDPEAPAMDATRRARQTAMAEFSPDNPAVCVLMEDAAEDGDARGATVAQCLLDELHCRRVLRVERYPFETLYGFCMSSDDSWIVYPSEIIEGALFLGPLASVTMRCLESLRITHVVSILSRPVSPCDREHLQCYIEDEGSEDLTPVIQSALPFIRLALSHGGRVLVHCEQGRSRSTSVVVAHLMQSADLTADEALAVVRLQRPQAQPNEGFMSQLRRSGW